MKNILLLLALPAIFSCSLPADESEIEAIKKAIETETLSFYKVNKKGWQDSWVHGAHAYWSYSDSTGTSFLDGWETIDNNFAEYFATQVPNRNIDVARPKEELTIERDWKEFRVYKNGAYVQYTQRVKEQQIKRDETSQIRIMEKVDGKWLVAYVGIIAKYN